MYKFYHYIKYAVSYAELHDKISAERGKNLINIEKNYSHNIMMLITTD